MASRPGRQQTLLALTRLVMISLLRLSANSVAARPMRHEDLQIFQRFNALIEERYAEHWPLSLYASRIGVTEARLNDVCRRIADLPSKRLVYERLMQESKRLLLFTGGSVNEICYQLGFKDPAYFSRLRALRRAYPQRLPPATGRRGVPSRAGGRVYSRSHSNRKRFSMHDATSMPPQAPSTWADYLAGYRWRGQGEGCSAATVHRLERAAADPVRQAGSAVRTCRAARRNRPPALAARCRHRLPAGAERNPERRPAMAADERRAGDTLSALAQRGELEPERLVRLVAAALRRLHDLDPAACPFDHRLERRLDTVRQRVEAGLVDEADFDDDHRGRSATELYRLLLDRRPAVEDLVVAHGDAPAQPLAEGRRFSGFIDCGRLGVADRHQDLALARGTSRPNSARPAEAFLVEYGGDIDGERLAYFRLLDEFFRAGPVRGRLDSACRCTKTRYNGIGHYRQRHRAPSLVPRSRRFSSAGTAPVLAESTRIRLGSVLCMACQGAGDIHFAEVGGGVVAHAVGRARVQRVAVGVVGAVQADVAALALAGRQQTQVPWQTLLDGTSASKPDSRSRRPMRIASGTLPPMLFSRSSLRERFPDCCANP